MAWHINNGYAVNSGYIAPIPMHRVILGIPKLRKRIGNKIYIDHINRNPLDNRKCNLRLVSATMSVINTKKMSNTKSIYKSVCPEHSKNISYWFCKISFNNNQVRMFTSSSEIECAYAYNCSMRLLGAIHFYINPVEELLSEEIKNVINEKVKKKLLMKGFKCK